MRGFPGLEINGPILHLQQDIAVELAVERYKLIVRLLGSILAWAARVHKCPPNDDAAMWRESCGEHVGAVGVRTAVILRAGLSFGVGFDQEAAEVRNVAIYLVHLLEPPVPHRRIQWIGRLQSADFDRRRETRR